MGSKVQNQYDYELSEIMVHKGVRVAVRAIAFSSAENKQSYRQVSNIRRTKSQHLKDSRIALRLSLPNPLKPDVGSRTKM